jgi:hypothetical protein
VGRPYSEDATPQRVQMEQARALLDMPPVEVE